MADDRELDELCEHCGDTIDGHITITVDSTFSAGRVKYQLCKTAFWKPTKRLAFMRCICTDKPDVRCWQYEHHLEHAGQPGAFPKTAFPRNTLLTEGKE